MDSVAMNNAGSFTVAEERLADANDLSAIANLHKVAYSRNHLTALFPLPLLIRYYSYFISEGSEIRLALDENGSILGFAAYGINIPQRIAIFKKKFLNQILGVSLRHPATSSRKVIELLVSRIQRSTPYPPAEFLLLSIAVAEPLKGGGKQLLAAMIAAARQRGCNKMGLYVNSDNIRAINAYYGVGFRLKALEGRQYYMELEVID